MGAPLIPYFSLAASMGAQLQAAAEFKEQLARGSVPPSPPPTLPPTLPHTHTTTTTTSHTSL